MTDEEAAHDSMSQLQSYSFQLEVQFRSLCPADLEEVKRLCTEWFPIEYPDAWYQEITSNPKFYSLAATYHSRIIGLVVCEIKTKAKINNEDEDLLAPSFTSSTQVAYILSLGVVVDYRRNGIASLLLDSLLSYLTSKERQNCKAVYLHVLCSNTTAIRFYEQRNFRKHIYLPYYYTIQGKSRGGYSYVLYINDGKPPWSFIDCIRHCGSCLTKLQPCALLLKIILMIVQRCGSRMLTSGSTDSNANYTY